MNVIVTGATKGIGKAIAELMLSEGNNVGINSRNQDEIDALLGKWKLSYPDQIILGQACDMSQKAEIETFSNYMMSNMDIDILINNAGYFEPGEILSESDGVLEKMINVNLYSAYYLSRKICPSMIKRGRGHIFNMCSVASLIAYPNGGSYSISKFALLGFSKVLREELKSKGIKVTAILPGATWSNSWAGVDLPEERLMQANDIALCVSNAIKMSDSAVVEEIVIRPQLGDL